MLTLLTAVLFVNSRVGILAFAPLDLPPDALAFRAHQILNQLGYPGQPRATAYGFDCCDADYLTYLERFDTGRRDALLATHQPAVIRFWYRQHEIEFKADSFLRASPLPPVVPLVGAVTYDSPANTEPGMVRMALDATGRLIALEAQPPASDAAGSATTRARWTELLAVAGLDPDRFTPAAPHRVPPMAFDSRAAWDGTFADGRAERVRVEAASWAGRPVFFSVEGDWRQPVAAPNPGSPAYAALLVMGVSLLFAGATLARRNLSLGRGDRRGAAILACAMFVVTMLSWALLATHVTSLWELTMLIRALCFAAFGAGAVWINYLAIEPYMRRYWPDALISWTDCKPATCGIL